jgi:glycosyltransferase involved in cell wall biosynthesis
MTALASVCFVGHFNLPILARGFEQHRTGGEEVQQSLLACALAQRGYRVSMVVGDYGQPDGQQWQGVTTWKTYAMDAGLKGLRFFHPRWTSLWSALRRADADVYYVSPAGMQLGQVALFARIHGRRVIFRSAHDANCDPKTLMIRFWRDRRLYEYGLRRADVILAQTGIQQRMIRQNYALDSDVAVMMVESATRQADFQERDIDVLWVNNLRRFKRPDLMVELAQLLPEARLHMVGGRVPGFDDVHRQLLTGLPAVPQLKYHGAVPYHDVNDLYERARVFVNTSDTEGFPNSYLQAWIRGTPVVAFFDPDGVIAREGLGVVPRSLTDMRDAVQGYLGDPSLWLEASGRCRRYMQAHYDQDQILAPYLRAIAGRA